MFNHNLARAVLGVLLLSGYTLSLAAVRFTTVAGDYTKIDQVFEYPQVITDFFRNIPDCYGLANKNEDVNFGCGLEDGKPCAKLVSGGHFNNIWFMLWEAGGAAHHYEFFAFSLTNNNKIYTLLHRDGVEGKTFSKRELTDLLSSPPKCEPEEGSQYKRQVDYGLCEEFH